MIFEDIFLCHYHIILRMDGEIVGLDADSNGRSCSLHATCGQFVKPNDLVRFKEAVVEVDGRFEEAVKVVVIRNGEESCTVGFL